MAHDLKKLVMPDLGLGQTPLVISTWLVQPDGEVTQGDRLLEVLAGDVTVDLPSPASGVLVAVLAAEDDVARPGQTLALIRVDAPQHPEA